MTILIALIFMVVMREKPLHPPSKIADTQKAEMTMGMWKDVGILLRNCNFMSVLVVYSILYSVINSMMDAISPIFHTYYDNESFISTIAIIQILTSVVTELLTGFYLDKTKRYLCTLRTTVITSTIIAFGLIWAVPYGNPYLCACAIALSGLAIGPIFPVGFDFSI